MTEHTPTPWSLCNDGKCSCLTVSCPDYPIAKVESGEWGDEYPAMRQVGASLDNKYEAYMERIGYGSIDQETARANARFILMAVNSHDKMAAALESIAGWQKVNISAEYEHGLRDIIRSITDCAAAALAVSSPESNSP